MSDDLATLVALVAIGALMLFFFGAARAAGKPVPRNRREDAEREWLDQPGDDRGSDWTNFDYIVAEEMEDEWDGDG